ncbi:transmembrane protein 135 [Scaptodrosophila lebanonensis]|uniref:Transmembrane protein 135 n=1 Tax=Drosophila lebanonensis TaxID=7225 RepID=A0A6J2TLM3_DROLE|nr:transmembrane protein 135 [Scaptodrosophila lebanonensis]XP_030376033.1 transmembrane protein 135 [Scaptodrosophila lebanonensis]
MTVQSKLLDPLCITCKDFQHPWTDKCANATAGILLSSTPYCLRVYTVVYALSLLMRHRIPTLTDLRRTLLGIIQSTAFLVTNAYTFILYNCLLRNVFGRYYFSTVAFVPCFMASFSAILVERPARRPLLTLYVANVATETLWRMGESRGWLRSLPHGQTIIFGLSISALLYLNRLGLQKTIAKDSIFNILRIFVGKEEAGPVIKPEPVVGGDQPEPSRRRPTVSFSTVADWVRVYSNLIRGRHSSCQHKQSCATYAVLGGLKPFVGGVALQVALKLVMNIKKVTQGQMQWRKHIFNNNTLHLGFFMGSFSFLYKSISCLLRHSFNRDDALFAIPAGLIASLAFTQYPDNTVALYVMWKALQILYNIGQSKGVLPHVPNFMLFLYSFFTAVLFHAGILEPKNLRPSYFKFLQAISGERLSKFNLSAFDTFGLNTQQQAWDTIKALNIVNKVELPVFSFAS